MVVHNYKRKFVVIDKLGKIVIITRDKNIAMKYEKWSSKHDRV
tara:strand:- start:676 stop:804 length:129 start_codon:yes stop_codon:yes gene_type:complete